MLTTPCRSQIEQDPEDRQAWFRSMWEAQGEEDAHKQAAPLQTEKNDGQTGGADDHDDFGDDFDDFAEGGDDDDFGDFDNEPTTPGDVDGDIPDQSVSYALPDTLAGLVSSHVTYYFCTSKPSLTPSSATP